MADETANSSLMDCCIVGKLVKAHLFVKHCLSEDEILPCAKCRLLGVAQTYSEDGDEGDEEYRIMRKNTG